MAVIVIVEIILYRYKGAENIILSSYLIFNYVSNHLATWVLAMINLLLLHCYPSRKF